MSVTTAFSVVGVQWACGREIWGPHLVYAHHDLVVIIVGLLRLKVDDCDVVMGVWRVQGIVFLQFVDGSNVVVSPGCYSLLTIVMLWG